MQPRTIKAESCASFDTAWRPDSYLAQYYSAVENDERATMRFLAETAERLGPVPALLEFGCGPTVHHLFSFAPRACEIHVADYLPANLRAVQRWVHRKPDAHDWSPFAEYALRCELGRVPTFAEVAMRERVTRQRITRYVTADARCAAPLLDDGGLRKYPAVLCCFCPDSITDDFDEWRRCTLNVASLVARGGWFALAALRATDSYAVGNVRFPSAGVTEDDVALVLAEAGFRSAATTVTVAQVRDERRYGFGAVILAVARRL